jgi:hypothetical protein
MYVRGYPWREREASYLAGYPDIELPAVTEAEVVSSGAPGLPGGATAPGASEDAWRAGIGRGAPSGCYRAQFAYRPAPTGFHDEDFTHFYNAISTPALGMTIAAGDTLKDIPLVLETDADFIARGIRIMGQARFQFREPSGLWLSEQYPAPPPHLVHSYQAGGLDLLPAGTFELPTVPLEPAIGCLAGSAFLLYLYNPAAIPVAVNGWVAIFGVKRYANGC